MSSIITNVGTVVRAWTDVSSKIKAAAAGGFTAGGVTSILAVVFPDWHPAAWLVGLITLAAAVIAGYLKGDKLTIGATVVGTGADGTVTSSPVSVDLPALPLVPELAAVIKAQDEVGADEDIDAPKHLAD
ncbi:hypothetical protein NY588_09520 [Curtobacterium flaccumfaciens pv. beticola]|uniref:hypothetical protein n=1 Tax=Curtobacterium flaccumfaciens TaxID=2035 RepID=UPI00349F14B1|nr:hypothetical protein [Curtobacterium flaccumfaciens pv. basellae]